MKSDRNSCRKNKNLDLEREVLSYLCTTRQSQREAGMNVRLPVLESYCWTQTHNLMLERSEGRRASEVIQPFDKHCQKIIQTALDLTNTLNVFLPP